jgi:hypothetical protein
VNSRELAFKATLLPVLLTLTCIAVQAQLNQFLDPGILKISKTYTAPSIKSFVGRDILVPMKGRKLVVVELSGFSLQARNSVLAGDLFYATFDKDEHQADAVAWKVEVKTSLGTSPLWWWRCGSDFGGCRENIDVPSATPFTVLVVFNNVPKDVSEFKVRYLLNPMGTAVLQQ